MIRALWIPVLAATLLAPFGGRAHRLTEQGNRSYEDGSYEEALRAYTEAQVEVPEAPELHYDIGNVLYRQGDHAGAAEAFTRSLLSASPALEADAAFNLGNALFRDQRYDEAVRAYRRSLEADPSDGDAKRNLELALRALEERSKSRQPQQGNEEKQDDPQQQQQERQQQEQEEQEQTAEDPHGQPSPNEPQDGSRDAEAQRERQGEMTPEEAERLLEGLAEHESETLRRRALRQAHRETTATEKDW